MIKQYTPKTKDHSGAIGAPQPSQPSATIAKPIQVTKPDTGINQSYDHTNRSAKWRRPNPQDIHPKAQGQYQW